MAIGTALNCEIRPSTFHRKNYFYPDQAKDYQISQYDEPINVDGHLDLPDGTTVGIERAHMEEDTGKTTHAGTSGRIHGADYSLVDYNRSGVPAGGDREPARTCARRPRPGPTPPSSGPCWWRRVRPTGRWRRARCGSTPTCRSGASADDPFGTRCEIKNLNSVRSLGRAIDYEADRQIALIESGEAVVQQTRHWDEGAGRTVTLRSKEDAYDYRYFLEPDLVPLVPDAEWIRAVADTMGLMPAVRRARLMELFDDPSGPSDAQRRPGGHRGRPGPGRPGDRGRGRRGGRRAGPGPDGQRGRHRRRSGPAARPELLCGPADHGGVGIVDRHPGQGRPGRAAGCRGGRSGGHRRGQGLRGHVRGLAGGRGGRRWWPPTPTSGTVTGTARTRSQEADRLLHRAGDEGHQGPGRRQGGAGWSWGAYGADGHRDVGGRATRLGGRPAGGQVRRRRRRSRSW